MVPIQYLRKMNIGFDTTWFDLQKWIGKYVIKIHFPNVLLGIFTGKEEKFIGFKFQINSDVSFEKYDYGYVLNFIILGFGISINRVNV